MNASPRRIGRHTSLRWGLILPSWICLGVISLVHYLATASLSEAGMHEAAQQNVTTHASHLAAKLSARPDAAALHDLNARLSHAVATADLLAIAVYQPLEAIGAMRRIAVQSASDSTLHHFPAQIDTPDKLATANHPSSSSIDGLHIATAYVVVGGEIRAAIRVATPLGPAASRADTYRAWGLAATLLFMVISFYIGDRSARRISSQLQQASTQIEAIATGHYDQDFTPVAADLEFEQLGKRLHALATQLDLARAAFEDSTRNRDDARDRRAASEISALHNRLEERSRMLEQAYTEMQTLDKAKEAFLSNLSHEMRTPLTSIIAAEEILADFADDDPESRFEFLGIIHTESQRLLLLIDELLDLAKIEAQALHLNFETTDLCLMIDQIAAEVFAQPRDKKVALSISKSVDHLLCECDVDRIARIVRSLTEDAFRFSPALGTVYIRLRLDENWARITIEDGTPLTTERTNDMFGQGTDSVDELTGGSMLGPSIADKLARAHGGTLSQGNSSTGGTVAELSLPTRLAKRTPASTTDPARITST